MHASNLWLTVRDHHNVLCNTDPRAWVIGWLCCGARGPFVSHCVGCQVDCPLGRVYDEVEYHKDLSTLVQHFDGRPLPETAPLFVVFRCPFSNLCFAERFKFWAHNCAFELHLLSHARETIANLHNVQLFALLVSHWPSHYFQSPDWWWELEGSRLLCVATNQV